MHDITNETGQLDCRLHLAVEASQQQLLWLLCEAYQGEMTQFGIYEKCPWKWDSDAISIGVPQHR